MKRIVTLILAAGLVLGASFSAQAATEIKAKGTADFEFSWVQNVSSDGYITSHNAGNDPFSAVQRFRTQFDFVTSESLSGTLFFEIGNQTWGQNRDGNTSIGAALGTDGINIETRRAYIDWVIPGTPATVRMGLQGLALPSSFGGSAVLDDDVAAINVSYPINNNFAVTAFWARPFDLNTTSSNTGSSARWDEVDLFGVVAPLTYDGWNLTPWAMFGLIGRDVITNIPGATVDADPIYTVPSRAASLLAPVDIANQRKQVSAWWLGATGNLTMFDPFTISFDANYGSVEGRGASQRSGWYAGALAQYKLAMFTPGLYAWYGSGDDGKVNNGSERLPNFNSGQWGYSTFGQNAAFGLGTRTGFTGSPAGNWGIGIQATNISFIENLSHTLRFVYTQGTNSKNAPAAYLGSPVNESSPVMGDGTLYLTNKDDMFEVNFNTMYNIYDNLALAVELGYADLNLSKSVWGDSMKADNLMRAAINFQYSF